MISWQELTIDVFVEQLNTAYQRTYGDVDQDFGRIVAWCGRLALENIANSDALFHDVDHTIMVSLAGQAIIEGKHLREGGVTPRDWMHFMIAVICHDIGYVKGVCRNDLNDTFATGVGNETVFERFETGLLQDMTKQLDTDLIASYIEMTRFPSPDGELYKDTKGFGGLVRSADFVGQLGDPDYLRKVPALFYEFHELGLNEAFGYHAPNDLRKNYASFYWNSVSPYIQDALQYLRLTEDGKQWIANMHSHVFDSEHFNSNG